MVKTRAGDGLKKIFARCELTAFAKWDMQFAGMFFKRVKRIIKNRSKKEQRMLFLFVGFIIFYPAHIYLLYLLESLLH